MDSQEIQALIDKDNLGRIAATRYEAESFLQLHPEYFVTRTNGEKMTSYMAENGIALNAEGFEQAFQELKAAGEILPPRESLAKMSADEIKKFAAEHGEPVTDPWGRTGYDLPAAYREASSSEGYVRPRQGATLQPVEDLFPQDRGKTFTPRQVAAFSADRFKAYHERMGTWGRK